MKVIQEVVSPEVSKLNHAVMNKNKKQGDQIKYSFLYRKKTRKKKVNSSNPSSQSMDCVIKWGIQVINSIRNFFICLKMFIMQQKNS